ncbi:MAG: high-affinity branched-chain amino acid ABC transporter permease LivM [Parvibaculum sp.]|nr:high-affinity branched-chain amino acid ABC transporter permease LivM [Parvibaculum sp.]
MALHTTRPDVPALLRDAGLAGFVAALLAFPLLGFELNASAQGITLNYRLLWIVYAAAIVFAGRLGISLALFYLAPQIASLIPKSGGLFARLSPHATRYSVGVIMIVLALALPWAGADRNLVDKATLILIYIMLGWGLNIVVGLAGLLDLGYVAFYAVGAYSYAILSTTFGLSFWICLPLAGLLAGAFGIALGFPVLRLRGDYLAIVTLGFGEIIREIIINWQVVTGGPNGIGGIARPSFFGLEMLPVATEGHTTFSDFFNIPFSPDQRVIFLYYLILMLALATNFFTLRIRQLPIGRAWEALREDEIACRSLGLNPTMVKLSAFAIGATFAGFAGSFFAARQNFISPESFTFIESAIILAIVVLGGMGSQIGIVLAAILLVGLPEWFRDLAEFRMVAFGAAMVLIMIWRPQGLLSHREPTLRLGSGGSP